MTTAFTLDGASAGYGKQRVLGPVSLIVDTGEQVALVGRSGAGKSTLLSLLFDHKRRDLALLPQELGLVPTLSVFHNVYMGRLAAHGTLYNLANLIRPFAHERAAVRKVLEPLGLAGKIEARAGELSGGQRQRTAVARALYQNAGILLADEPISALDLTRAEQVMAALAAAYPTTVIAMHDVELALRHTGRIVGIDDGEIVLDELSCRLSVHDLLPLYDNGSQQIA